MLNLQITPTLPTNAMIISSQNYNEVHKQQQLFITEPIRGWI
jgi:hypothetical protein